MLLAAVILGVVVSMFVFGLGAESKSEGGRVLALLSLLAMLAGIGWLVVSAVRWLWANPLF